MMFIDTSNVTATGLKKRRHSSVRITLLVLVWTAFACIAPRQAYSQTTDAWTALHNLDIQTAKTLFEQAIEESPDDPALMRGLILALYFDSDPATQVELVHSYLENYPADPYLLCLFEHIAVNLDGVSQLLDLQYQISQRLIESAPGPLRFNGQVIRNSHYEKSILDMPDAWRDSLGRAPGCWVAAPFENGSRIAAFRPLEYEGQPLDTSAVTVGTNGVRVEWVWLPADQFGDVGVSSVMEDLPETAAQLRYYLSLPQDQEVLVLLSGAFHYRMLLDGTEVQSDRVFRNSHQRDGIRVALRAGRHEITLVAGFEDYIGKISVSVLDSLYQPIPDLRWGREPISSYSNTPEVEHVHPVFDTFEAHVAEYGEESDTRYWYNLLRLYNGYSQEVVKDLEELKQKNELSHLETWLLKLALELNVEPEKAALCLSEIVKACETPLTEISRIAATGDGYEAMVRAYEDLNRKYPGRPQIKAIAAMRPLIDGDLAAFVDSISSFEDQYPDATFMTLLIANLYKSSLDDGEAALREFLKYCEKSGDMRARYFSGPSYYTAAGRHEEAIALALDAVDKFPCSYSSLSGLARAAAAADSLEVVIPFLEDRAKLFPSDLELYDWLVYAYNATGRVEEVDSLNQLIHFHKPAVIRPYKSLDALHNEVPYDSIFGSTDAMELWNVSPTEEQLAAKGLWSLIDRNQTIVFESGVNVTDIHRAWVLVEEGTVEEFQEYGIGFTPQSGVANLIFARRLRKGAPPVEAVHQGYDLVFQDLQPGDAVEYRYRVWGANDGDLWNEYWDSYQTGASYYQRLWEYVVLTERDDLNYSTLPPVPEPERDKHCGFTRIAWREGNADPIDLNSALLPPTDDIAGKIFISTLDSWDTINKWYSSISEAILNENPRSLQLADSLTVGLSTDSEKLKALYDEAVLNIPYQTIRFNYDGSIPHTPDEVLVNRWGDCKDKSVLLTCMLRHIGIEAWPVLVMTRSDGTQLPIPIFGFNHLVLACMIDGDTVYVDPTGMPFAPKHSLGKSVAGQPCLHIKGTTSSQLTTLPRLSPEDLIEKWELTLTPDSVGRYNFQIEREYRNVSAGYKRQPYFDDSYAELVKNKESYFASEWGVTMNIDTLLHDEIKATSEAFCDGWSGTVDVVTQELGKNMIVSPPRWSVFDKSILPRLSGYVERTQPVDLWQYSGNDVRVLKYTVPEGWDSPEIVDPVQFRDSLMYFSFEWEWDPDSRVVALTYSLSIEDGLVPAASFASFVERVVDIFESPLLLKKAQALAIKTVKEGN